MTESFEDPDQPTLPPQPVNDEATVPPSPAADAMQDATIPPDHPGTKGELDTLPSGETAWRPGGTIRYFGDYELLSEIARGGMGVVYRAKQTSLNRIVALKMILAGQLAGEEEVQRFHAEAEAAANLDHPGIVPIYEVGECEGQHYFSMGFVDGSSLSDLISEQPLPPEEAAELTLKIAEAIAYAHEQGVIHRDLKPANVLVQKRASGSSSSLGSKASVLSGNLSNASGFAPRVTDFGLAKQVKGDDQLTASGQILGTPSYMPPEQAAGQVDEVDHRSDVYSLGGILYALITGRPPFQAANQVDTLLQVMEKEPIRPRQLDPKLPKDIETIALKALEKDNRRRYQSATELAEDLQRFLNGEPILARSISSVERAWRWARRKPVVAGLGAIAAALLLVVSIGGPIVAVQQASLRSLAEEREEEAKRAKQAAQTAAEQEKAAKQVAQTAAEQEKAAKQQAIEANDALKTEKEKAERTLYARTISLAYQAWHDDNVHRSEDLLNKTNHQYRDWEWQFIKRLCNSERQTLRGHTAIPFRMQMSKDGKRLVSIGRVNLVPQPDPSVYYWDLEAGNVLKKLPYRGFAISPDATHVALEKVSDGPVIIMELETGKEVVSIRAHGGGTAWANFNSDGTKLVTTGPDQTVRIWDAKTGEELVKIQDVARRLVHDVNFSPDDQLLVWKTFDGFVQIYDATSGEKVIQIEDRIYRNDAVGVAISPDNKILAAASDGPINFFDIETGEKIAALHGHRSSVLDLAFSPDGKRLASCGVDGTVRIWDVAQRRESFRLRGHKFGFVYGVFEVNYSADGKWILSGGADTTIKIWPADAGDGFLRDEALANADDVDVVQAALVYPEPSQEKDWLVGNLGFVEAVAFSPDGKRIATAGQDDRVRIYDAERRELLHTFDDHPKDVGAVAFSSDGKWLVSGEGGINETRNGKLILWDLEEKKSIQTITGHSGPVSKVIFDPSNKIVYSATGSQRMTHRGEVIAWVVGEDRSVFKYEDVPGVSDLALSPDGSVLAVSTYSGPIHLLDAQTGKRIKTLGDGSQVVRSLAFSPDGKRIVVGDTRWAVGVWDVESGEQVWEKIDHSGAVLGVAYASGGKRIFSTSLDRSTRVWDAESGDMLVDLRGESLESFGVSVSPDGNTIASFGEAPYVTLRGLDAAPLASAEADQEWPVIFADDFERKELGDTWTIANGTWEIEDGAAKGTLKSMPSIPIPNFAATTLIPKAWFPSVCEIEFDAWSPSGLVIETKLGDVSQANGLDSLFVAMQTPYFNQNRMGGSLVVQAAGGFAEVARTGPVDWFKPNQKYRLKTIRRGGRWQMFVDGKPLLEEEVPDSMWAPSLFLQGSFAPAGTVFYLDNLVVRAPASTADELEATELEYQLRKEMGLTPVIVNAIEQNTEVSDSVRELAIRYAKLAKDDPKQTFEAIWDALEKDDLDRSTYKSLMAVIKKQIKGADDDWKHRQQLAAAHFRLGDYPETLALLKQAELDFVGQNLFSHPINMALLALTADAIGDGRRSKVAMDRLKELLRGRYWKKDLRAVNWATIAKEIVKQSEPEDLQLAEEIESIKRLTFDPQERARCDFDLDDFFAAYAEDAVHIEGRAKTPNESDLEVTHQKWLAAQKVFSQGFPSIHEVFVRNRADVSIDGEEAVLKCEYAWGLPFATWRYENETKLKRVEGEWKIVRERNGQTGLRIQREVWLTPTVADWAKEDAEVKEAKKKDDQWNLMMKLEASARYREAYEAGIRHRNQEGKKSADFWSGLAHVAFSALDGEVMLSAGKKAVQLDRGMTGASFIRALAVKENLPDEPMDVGEGIQVRTPAFIPQASLRDFSVPGKVLRAWYPSNRSGLVVFYNRGANDKPDQTLQEGMEEVLSGMKATLNATVHRKGISKVAGNDAIDFIVEGAGSGRSIAKTMGEPGKGTVMRWVIVLRGENGIGFLLTAASNEFDERNAEFQTWLEHVEIDDEPQE